MNLITWDLPWNKNKHTIAFVTKVKIPSVNFRNTLQMNSPPQEFEKSSTGQPGTHERIEWTHGTYAGMDCIWPQAWAELLYKFEELGRDELTSRCMRQHTNANEFIHQKVALFVTNVRAILLSE